MPFWYSAFVYLLGRQICHDRSKNYLNLHTYNNWWWRHPYMSFKWANQCVIRSMNIFVGNAKVMDWCGVTCRLSKIYISNHHDWLRHYPNLTVKWWKIPCEMWYERENVFFWKIEGFLWIISEKALPKRLTPICYVILDS